MAARLPDGWTHEVHAFAKFKEHLIGPAGHALVVVGDRAVSIDLAPFLARLPGPVTDDEDSLLVAEDALREAGVLRALVRALVGCEPRPQSSAEALRRHPALGCDRCGIVPCDRHR